MFSKLFKHKGVQAPLTLSMVFLDECRVREEIKVTENLAFREGFAMGRDCQSRRSSVLDTDHVFGQKGRVKKNQAESGEQIRLIHLVLGIGAEQSSGFASS